MFESNDPINSRWQHRDPFHQVYRGRPVTWTVIGWAPRARGYLGSRLLRVRSNGGSVKNIHPKVLAEYYEQVPLECSDTT